MERRRKGSEDIPAEELLLDDIVIERLGDGVPAALQEDSASSVGEEIVLEGEEPVGREEPALESAPRRRTMEHDIPDLESLSAEVDGISAVDSGRSDVAEDREGLFTEQEEQIDRIEDVKIDDEMVFDLDAEAQQYHKEVGKERAVESETTAETPIPIKAHDPHDELLDDEFLILEDESGLSVSAPSSPASMEKKQSPPEEGKGKDEPVSIFLEEEPAPSPVSESTESEIDEIIRSSETPVQETPIRAAEEKEPAGLSITLPEDVAKSLSEEFDIHTLEPIDLREAEKIANEDILILKEEDLIEELDAMDLIPLDDEAAPAKKAVGAKKVPAGSGASRTGAGKKAEVAPVKATLEVPLDVQSQSPALSKDSETDTNTEIPEASSETLSQDSGEMAKAEELEVETPIAIEDELSSSGDGKKEHSREDLIEEPILLELDERELREVDAVPEMHAKAIDIIDEMPAEIPSNADLRSTALPHEHEEHITDEDVIHIHSEKPGDEITADTSAYFEEAIEQESLRPLVRERIPDEFTITGDRGRVLLIDDIAVEKDLEESESIFADGELEKTTVGLVDVVEGNARFIQEASPEEDQEQMAAIMSGTAMAFEDLLVDFSEEYKFKDEDIDFIDSVFVAESANQANALAEEDRKRKKSRLAPAMEIFGLSDLELFEIETLAFTGEYKEIDLSKVKGALPAGLDQAPADFALVKNCRYIGTSSSDIAPVEKQSIEEDIVDDQALVFEESVEDIRRVLLNYRKAKRQHPDDVMDISDEIVIIDDKSDVERFADTFEPEKRENIKKLLKYLDGLFEKLPEEVVRKFAESEYFNLYVRIMKELER